jgi:hypothetical protein
VLHYGAEVKAMHPPDEILWGEAPDPGPALRSQVDQATQEANRIPLNRGFFALCLVALVVFLALGVIRLLIFGPWWPAPHRAAQPSGASAIQRDGRATTHPAHHTRTSPKPNQQPTQMAR